MINNSRYLVTRDGSGTWRILDTLDDNIQNILRAGNPEADIPDDSDAVTLLTDGQFTALIQTAVSLGYNLSDENIMNMGNLYPPAKDDMGVDILPEIIEKSNIAYNKLNLVEKILSKDMQPDDMVNIINAVTNIGGNTEVE